MHFNSISLRSALDEFAGWKVVPVSTCIDDLALAESARFETRDGVDALHSSVPVVLDLTGGDTVSESELRTWRSTPQQMLSALQRGYPDSSESTVRRRLRKGLQIKPVKTFYSSHNQNCLHLSRIDRTDPGWESNLSVVDQSTSSPTTSHHLSHEGHYREQEVKDESRPPHCGILLHPLSATEHPASYRSLESKGSCISDWAWYPVLDAIGKFFTDVSLMSTSGSGQLPSFMDLNGPEYSDELRKPPRQSPFCIDSGLHEDWIQPLKRLWQVYPSQMLLFIEKQMVMALREVRAKVLSADVPPAPWTFWRRPNTPMCGLAPSNSFNPTSLEGESEMDADVLSPTLVNELTHRDSQFVVPSRGIPLEPMDALAISVLHRVMTYWEVMKVKVKELAQIMDALIAHTSREEYFNILMWYIPSSEADASSHTASQPSASYYSYNPFAMPGQDLDLRFDWIFQLLFRTVILRNYSVRSYLRRACFIYRQLFSLDQPKEVAEMLRLHTFEEDVHFMDENAWQWKFRLSAHHYITSSRVSHDLTQYPILYSPLVLPLLSPIKERARPKQAETLSSRWPILTATHLHSMATRYPPHRLGASGEKVYVAFSAMHLLEFPLAMPMEWNLLKDEAMSHSRIVEIVQLARRKHSTSYVLEDLDDDDLPTEPRERGIEPSKSETNTAAEHSGDREESKNENHNSAEFSAWNVPNSVAGYVTPEILSNILISRSNELDDDWSDDSDADYPEDDEDPGYLDDYGASEHSMLSDHSEYEYYESEEGEDGQHSSALTGITNETDATSELILQGNVSGSANGRSIPKSGAFGEHTTGSKRKATHEESSHPGSSFPSVFYGAQIDWSKIDTELVAAVMEGSSREDIARVIARRLGLGASQLPYEIADLIPEALMLARKKKSSRSLPHNQQEGTANPSPHRLPYQPGSHPSHPHHHHHHHHIDLHSLSVPLAVPPPPPPFEELDDAFQLSSSSTARFSGEVLTTSSTCSSSQEVLSTGKASAQSTVRATHSLIGPNGQKLTLAETKLEKLHPRLRPSRVTPTARDSIFQAPFGAESAFGLALPIPTVPPPIVAQTRAGHPVTPSTIGRISGYRALHQPFNSDDDDSDDDMSDPDDDSERYPPLRPEVVYNPDAPPHGDLCPSIVYPFSVAARLHELKMNDPFEGTTTYKLKSDPPSACSNAFVRSPSSIPAFPPPKSRPGQHGNNSNGPSKTNPTDRTKPTTTITLQHDTAALALAAKRAQNEQGTAVREPHVPGIADTSMSVDELLEFIEGPSATTSKTKGTKKKTASTPAKEEKKSTAGAQKTAAPPVLASAPGSTSTSVSSSTPQQHTSAGTQGDSGSKTSANGSGKEGTTTATSSSSNKSNSASQLSLNSQQSTSPDAARDNLDEAKSDVMKNGHSTTTPTATTHTNAKKSSTSTLTTIPSSKTVPLDQYPEFWNEEDPALDPEQRKALDEEISDFARSLLESLLTPVSTPSAITGESKTKQSSNPPKQTIVPNKASASLGVFKFDTQMFLSIANKARSDDRNMFTRQASAGSSKSGSVAPASKQSEIAANHSKPTSTPTPATTATPPASTAPATSEAARSAPTSKPKQPGKKRHR